MIKGIGLENVDAQRDFRAEFVIYAPHQITRLGMKFFNSLQQDWGLVGRIAYFSHCLVSRIAHVRYHLFVGYEAIHSWGFVASFGVIWPIKTIPSHRQSPLQSKCLFQSNCIHLSHPPTPVFSRLASYHYSRSCRYRYGSFPIAEVREYAYGGLYSMAYLG